MRSGLGGACVIGLLSSVLAGAACADDPAGLPPQLLDSGADRVVARTDVPSTTRKVGEVRLVTRGGATVVQTLLATRLLGRVVAEIRKKEEAGWTANQPGYVDMLRYLNALEGAEKTLRAKREAAPGGDRRMRLAIELVASDDAAGVVFAEFDGDEADGQLRPTARRPLTVLPLERVYVLRNMRLILADAFHVPEADVGRLGPLGPAAAGGVAP